MLFLVAAPIPAPCYAIFLCSTDSLHTREIRPVEDGHLIDAAAPVNHANLALAIPDCGFHTMNLLCAHQMSVLCCLMCFCGGWRFRTSVQKTWLVKGRNKKRDATLNIIRSKSGKTVYFILEKIYFIEHLYIDLVI